MFGFLKKKLSNAIESISEKFKKKEEVAEKVEAVKEELEKKIEEIPVEEKKPEEIIEEVKPIIEKEIPEVKEEIEKEIEKTIEEAKPEIVEAKPMEKKSLFKKLTEKIVKKVTEKKLEEEDLEPVLNELENGLIESDVAYEVAEKIKSDLKKNLVGREIKKGKEKEAVIDSLRQSLLEVLSVPEIDLKKVAENKKPVVLLFLGFNGSGKTTSLAKVGKWLLENGKTCVFAASDTFRAASIEQLEVHANKIGVKVIKHKYNADPAAVAFDAIEHAKANGIDFVLIDSAGRAHTNRNLMEQMQKIIRVNKPDFKILVIDSMTGNDAVLQARVFNEVGLDGVIFTKIDVNEKGGAVLSVTYEIKRPILFLSTGQEYSDFIKFDAKEFVDRLI
ncbi:MAG TPA: signal recognition particle-docking protein FtsY [archaeon]|nr:signal recognition particle-docking protein FtsY [archaeon]